MMMMMIPIWRTVRIIIQNDNCIYDSDDNCHYNNNINNNNHNDNEDEDDFDNNS